MIRTLPFLSLVVLLALAGCAPPPSETPEPDPVETTTSAPEFLPHPFTEKQIRDAWVEGLIVDFHRVEGGEERYERWRVVAHDEEGAEIENTPIDGDGNVVGEVLSRRGSWIAMRDHASFPADSSRREEITRETPLGTLDGWLYTVERPGEGTVSEFFFARDLPGAPVHAIVRHGQEIVFEITQLERSRP